jgi:NDP-sugar pyrophosphorylase family protein
VRSLCPDRYGTRLENDIKSSAEYKHLLGTPKPLIPVAGKPLVSHWIDQLQGMRSRPRRLRSVAWLRPRTRVAEVKDYKGSQDLYLVVNELHHARYVEWAKQVGVPADNIVNDGTTSNDNRIGAIADIKLVIEKAKIDDDLMILGGDTLFFEDFSLDAVAKTFLGARPSTFESARTPACC